jgi:small conductance mechanosensitive channel
MIMTAEYIGFALRRQASLERELAGLYRTCADVLVPPFWERHRKTLNSLVVVLVVVAISYGVKLGIWLTQRIVARVGAILAVRGAGFSVKRATTLLSFAGSIIKLFVWIFGAVAVLNEFGIDPAASTGAIGLIGLIMAGMFQQIVIDFVKGLDIIAGRHYNVGDFVELDGKLGHVVDISVKHTRIRTLSGQEFNLPNSRCVPSRRFPEGFVDNYVDVVLASSADEAQAKEAIAPVCADLNRRLEPIRSEPILDFRFLGPEDQATLRYLVRVLPGCDWVVTDHFIPAIKEALQKRGVHLASEPTFCFINRIATFRKLFSRQLTEEEIIRETRNEASTLQGRDTPASAGPPPTAGG